MLHHQQNIMSSKDSENSTASAGDVVFIHSGPLKTQMQVKALPCKEKAYCGHSADVPLSSLGQSSFKLDWGKVENCALVREVEILCTLWKLLLLNPPKSQNSSFMYTLNSILTFCGAEVVAVLNSASWWTHEHQNLSHYGRKGTW